MSIERAKSGVQSTEMRKVDSLTADSVGVGEVKPKVHFNLLTTFGVQFSVTATPLALGTYTSLTIGVGGSAGYFWGFIFVGIFQFITCLAVAEIASAIPHSSGESMFAGFNV
jgi:choline transport protein